MAKIYRQASGAATPPPGTAAHGDIAIRKDGGMLVCDSGGNWVDPSDAKTFGGQPPSYYGTAADVSNAQWVAGTAQGTANAVKAEMERVTSGNICEASDGTTPVGGWYGRGNMMTLSVALWDETFTKDTVCMQIDGGAGVPVAAEYACMIRFTTGTLDDIWAPAYTVTNEDGQILIRPVLTMTRPTITCVVLNVTAPAHHTENV